jgi:hypothetical protein
MKSFYIIFILFFYIFGINALLRKRTDEDQLIDAISAYLERFPSGDEAMYWNIYHYGETELEDIIGIDGKPVLNSDGTHKQMNVGHQWIVAEPLTEEGGVYDNTKGYIKLNLGYIPNPGDSYTGMIKTKISSSSNFIKEASANIINSGKTTNPVNIFDMIMELGTVDADQFQDGETYYKYSVNANCQGFSACQFDKIYKKFANDVKACTI